jgi:undecaprenyl-diphosphatase
VVTQRRNPWLLAGLALLLWLAAFALARAVVTALPEAVGGGTAVLTAVSPSLVADDALIATTVHEAVHDQQWVVWVARVFAVMGSGLVLTPVTIAVVIGLTHAGHRWWAFWVGACGMGGWIISQSVKHLVDRQRPVWPDPFEVLTSPSFPSGHSMAGVYGYVAFGIAALALLPYRWPGVALIVFGMLMGPSRVLLGVHWPTDVLMGWLLAGAWVCTAAAVVMWLRDRVHGAEVAGQEAPA